MRILLIGDLHLTDRPRDSYRFGIFDWVKKQQQIYKPDITIFSGDCTDRKDNHSATLVNKIVFSMIKLAPPIYVIKGNHDYIDDKQPFFKFLNRIEGLGFVVTPRLITKRVAAIPHFRDEKVFAQACDDLPSVDYLFIHQTLDGAIAESGTRLSGFSTSPIESLAPTWGTYAGDIHRPQRAGLVTYVGSPYNIRFGDDFQPRCLLLEDGKEKNLYFDCPRKWKLTVRDDQAILTNKDLLEGDQVKVTIELAREEAVDGRTYIRRVKDACVRRGLEVFGIEVKINTLTRKPKAVTQKGVTAKEIILSYCKSEGLSSQIKEAGLALCSPLKKSS
jgi:hypothetical protein